MLSGVFDVPVNSLILGVIILFLGAWLLNKRKRIGGLRAPGPRPWPILGNALLLAREPNLAHQVMKRLAKQYGPVMSLQIGSNSMVVLSDLNAAKEAFIKKADVFNFRPQWLPLNKYFEDNDYPGYGLVGSHGEGWKALRRFSMLALRDMGMGKKSIEWRIQRELEALLNRFATESIGAFDPSFHLKMATCNVICSIVFGERYEHEELKEWMAHFDQILRTFTSSEPSNAFHWLRHLPMRKETKKGIQSIYNVLAVVEKQFNTHKDSFHSDNLRDYIDHYIHKRSDATFSEEYFNEPGMCKVTMDLFIAGTETTATALTWAMLYMIKYPEVQEKCRDEIHQIIGNSRLPCLQDQPKMLYVEATILEIQRYATIVPLGVPHSTRFETGGYLGDFYIPEKTLIVLNHYAIHMSTEYWDEPTVFRPERWLDDEGKIIKHEAFMPFGIGPRTCLGESLARNELFILFTGLLQKFHFHKESTEQELTLDGILGVTFSPQAFKLRAEVL